MQFQAISKSNIGILTYKSSTLERKLSPTKSDIIYISSYDVT